MDVVQAAKKDAKDHVNLRMQKGIKLMNIEAIFIYCLCDEVLKTFNFQDDRQCKMNSAEIMTFTIISALHYQCNYKKTRLVTMTQNFFPKMLSQSRLVRRIHQIPENLWIMVFQICKEFLGTKQVRQYIVDSFPIPFCQNNKSYRCRLFPIEGFHGYSASKKSYFFGLKVHMIVDIRGIPVEFVFTPGGEADIKGFRKLECDLDQGSKIYADKAYSDYLQEDLLNESSGITLVPRRSKRLKRKNNPYDEFALSLYRNRIETTFSSIISMMPRTVRAVTKKGFCLKILFFILAFSIKRLISSA